MAARVAELEDDDERKATARVHQTSTMDAGLAAKLDRVLASLGSVQSRLEKLEKKEHGYHSASNVRHPKPFTGNCFGCGQPGHPKFRCPLNQHDLPERADYCRTQTDSRTQVERLVGQSNEVDILLQNTKCRVLLDTGSMVSTTCESFARSLQLSIHPLGNLLHVEGAGGHELHYMGYVEAQIECAELSTEAFNSLFLVVPDTIYHSRVPVLLGTNILRAGMSVKPELNAQTPWHLAF